jgi:hypothetical protein
MSDRLQQVLDRDAVTELRARFAWALDTRDWALFTSLFTPEVDLDLSELGGPAGPLPRESVTALFQRSFRRPREEMGTQQLYGNVVVAVTGDTATARSYLLGHHHVAGLSGGEEVTLRAAYEDRLVRTGGGWRIRGTTLRVLSLVGNAAILA